MGAEDREKGRRIGEALTEARIFRGEEVLKVAAAHGVTITGVMLLGDEESLEGVTGIEVVDGVWVIDQENGAVSFIKESAVAGVFGPQPPAEEAPAERVEAGARGDGDGQPEG